jgi:putative transposase
LATRGSGSFIFRDDEKWATLQKILVEFQGEWVEYHSLFIMPNRAHLLLKPVAPFEDLIEAWKGVSARLIGEGSIWQEDYRDTIIRDGKHFSKAVRYIRRNPVKLRAGEFSLWKGEGG